MNLFGNTRVRDALWCAVPMLCLMAIDYRQLVAHHWFAGMEFPDPDTAMRLAYLKQVDATGDWVQGFFRRNNAPYGMFLHWTLPFNQLLLAAVRLLRLGGAADPWRDVGFYAGPALRLAVAPIAYWTARILFRPAIACLCEAALIASPYLANYGMFGTANHHVPIYGLTILLIGVWFRAPEKPHSIPWTVVLGLLAGLSFWVTFELGFVIALLFGFIAARWVWMGGDGLRQLAIAGAAFSALITVAWWINPPYGGYATVAFDHLSPPYLAIAWAGTLVCLGYRLPLRTVRSRFAWLAGSGCACGAAWLCAFPQVRYGIMGQDNASSAGILATPAELLPLQTPAEFFFLLGPGLLAIALCAWPGSRVPHRLLLVVVLTILAAAGYRYYRLVCYVGIASAFIIGWAFEERERRGGDARQTGRLMLVALGAAIGLGCGLLQGYSNDAAAGTCHAQDAAAALNDKAWLAAPDEEPIVAAEMGLSPYILYETPLRTVAGLYHRDTQGVLDLTGIFQAADETAPYRITRQRGIDFMMVCGSHPDISEQHFSSRNGPERALPPQDTFYNRLVHRQYPDWLKLRPWPEGTKTGLLLYQVQPEALEEPR